MTQSVSDSIITDRRGAFAAAAGLGVSLAASPALAKPAAKAPAVHTSDCSTPHSAIVPTRYGKVRGYVSDGVFTFKGVPYGDTTAGANRWLRPQPPKAWEGEYPALAYGANCPQTLHSFRAIEHTFIQQWTDGFLGEDMLKLNIWTGSLSGAKPVMVYLHGGGFSFGSSYELASHDGAQMARHHDVVQVSVNHRLNVLGFLDLAEFGGEAYADSVNVSMLDLVFALEWVRDNIRAFGGDPDRVTIYGQSGGGSKVTTLMGMPAATGLFHRAIVQSGGGGNIPSAEQSRDFSRQVLRELGVAQGDMAALQKMEWQRLFEAGNAVATRINGPMRPGVLQPGGSASPTPRVGWAPTMDMRNITCRSFHDVSPPAARDIPVIIGNVSEEGTSLGRNPSEAEWRAQLAEALGGAKADALIAAMKKAHPEKAIRTLSYGVGGLSGRNNVNRMVKLRHDAGGAPAYQYLFQWQTPILDGIPGAWHTAELAFCFDNTKICDQATGNTPEAQAIARKMAGAWAAFAHTGKPDQPGLAWGPSDPAHCQTMVFDTQCRMENDPEGAVRRLLLG